MKKGKRDKWSPPFARLSRRLILKDENWHDLSHGAKALYLILKSHYNGSNNGQIRLPYSRLKGMRGFRNPSSIAAAFKELDQKNWIKREKRIGGERRWEYYYSLTGEYDELL